jgi:hypothetical protein
MLIRLKCLLGLHVPVPSPWNARYDICKHCNKKWRVV